MSTNTKVVWGKNSVGDSIVKKVVKNTVYSKDKGSYSSSFYYMILKEGRKYFANSDYINVKIDHGNPINYKHWHEDIILHDICAQILGYDDLKSMYDDENYNFDKLEKIKQYIVPISKDEYLKIKDA